jgi:hypothetical protein
MAMRRQLAEREDEMEAARIEKIGEALRANPDYLEFDLQQKMPDIYRLAGENGNLVLAAPSPSILLSPRPQAEPAGVPKAGSPDTPSTAPAP